MRIDNHAHGLVKPRPQNYVCGFARHSRHGQQFVHFIRHFAPELVDHFFCATDEGFRFVAEKAGGTDIRLQLLWFQRGKMFCRGIFLKEDGSHHIDAHIRALGGENGGHQQLPRAVMLEGTSCAGITLVQTLQKGCDSFRGEWVEAFLRRPGFCLLCFQHSVVSSLSIRDLGEILPSVHFSLEYLRLASLQSNDIRGIQMASSSEIEIKGIRQELPAVPLTIDGASVLHQMFRLRRQEWRKLTASQKQEISGEAAAVLSKMEQAGEGQSALFSLFGHKGDLLLVHFRKSFTELKSAELQIANLRLSD